MAEFLFFTSNRKKYKKGSSPVYRIGDPISRTGGAFLIARYKDENPSIRQDSRAKKADFFSISGHSGLKFHTPKKW